MIILYCLYRKLFGKDKIINETNARLANIINSKSVDSKFNDVKISYYNEVVHKKTIQYVPDLSATVNSFKMIKGSSDEFVLPFKNAPNKILDVKFNFSNVKVKDGKHVTSRMCRPAYIVEVDDEYYIRSDPEEVYNDLKLTDDNKPLILLADGLTLSLVSFYFYLKYSHHN